MKKEFLYVSRGIIKNKTISLVTIAGLSIALSICLLILFYVFFEFSHDRFHEKRDQIFKVVYSVETTSLGTVQASSQNYRLSEALKRDVPQVNHCSAFRMGWAAIARYQDQLYECTRTLGIVEPDFLKIFSFPLIAGYIDDAFESPEDVVITKRFADKILDPASQGYSDLIGKPIEFLNVNETVFTIKGILDEIPGASVFDFEILVSFEKQDYFAQSNNAFGNSSIYLELFPESDPEDAELAADNSVRAFYGDILSRFQEMDQIPETEDCFKTIFINIKDVYLSEVSSDYEASSDKIYSIILGIIGIVILLTACINYLLLSLGLTIKKSQQIGILKAFGASRWNILKRFWNETLILSFISIVIGLIISYLLFPVFKQLAQRDFEINEINKWVIIGFMALTILVVTIITSLPLVMLFRRVNPSLLLRKQISLVRKSWISNGFIIFQYIIATVLIISTIVILKQTKLLKTKSLGFDSDNIIELTIPSDFNNDRVNLLKSRLLAHTDIIGVTGNDKGFMGNRSSRDVTNPQEEHHTIRLMRIDDDFIETLSLDLIAGEDFSIDDISSSNEETIVNETFFKTMNMPAETGEFINITSWKPFRITGIVKDFHFDSMKDDIQPLMMIGNNDYERIRYLFIKYPEGKAARATAVIQSTWDELTGGRSIEYEFLSKKLASRYEDEESWGKIVGYSSLFAILISTLGLFGLSLIVVNKRVKEIGIRKVNGASVKNILLLLNKSFLLKIIIAYILACPLAYFLMNKWLENFAFKTQLNIWIFLLAGAIIILISIATVNWQCLKSARSNPVDTLKYE